MSDTFTIANVSFPYPSRFSEGHTLTANEAQAMNQLLAENLRNNFSGKVKKAQEEHGADLPAEVLAHLTKSYQDYAQSYEFGQRRTRSGEPVDPVAGEAYRLIVGRLQEIAKGQGHKVRDAEVKEKIEAHAQEILADKDGRGAKFWQLAAERIQQKQAIVQDDLGALFGEAAPTDAGEMPPKARRSRKADAQAAA